MTYRENKIADLIADLNSRNDCKTGENLVTRKKGNFVKNHIKSLKTVIKMVTQIILLQFGDKKIKELNC